MQILDRARGALMLDRPRQNFMAAGRELVSNGPIEGFRTAVKDVWHTQTERIDTVAGTKLSNGGPFQ
jgi:hypothetical protein